MPEHFLRRTGTHLANHHLPYANRTIVTTVTIETTLTTSFSKSLKSLLLTVTTGFLLGGCGFVRITADTDYSKLLANDKQLLTRGILVQNRNKIEEYHPDPFGSLGQERFDSLLETVAAQLPDSAVPGSEIIMLKRKLFDTITWQDPHFRIVPRFTPKGNILLQEKDILVLPFTLLCIDDTLLVDDSFSGQLYKGDRILAINGTGVDEYLRYAYPDRYMNTPMLQAQFRYAFAPVYHLEINRKGQALDVTLPGMPLTIYKQRAEETQWQEQVFDRYACGYIRIGHFDRGHDLSDRLEVFIREVKEKGYHRIILDVRNNSGGEEGSLSGLLSLMTDKRPVLYQSGKKVKVSAATLGEYTLSRDSSGKVVSLPDSLVCREIPLDTTKYMGRLDYYVLVGRNTGSMAASFADAVQYNGIAKLVGEPLLHNAHRFGDVRDGHLVTGNAVWTISTTEIGEYSKAIDGIICPDIPVPCIARDYMKGGDPVLEQLMENGLTE